VEIKGLNLYNVYICEGYALSETIFDKEQQVFSDHSIKIGAGSEKDFKQMALKNHSDMINGVDEKERREESELMQSYAEMARDQLNKFHDRLAIRLDGLSVSSATARKAATFFLDNFDQIADRSWRTDQKFSSKKRLTGLKNVILN